MEWCDLCRADSGRLSPEPCCAVRRIAFAPPAAQADAIRAAADPKKLTAQVQEIRAIVIATWPKERRQAAYLAEFNLHEAKGGDGQAAMDRLRAAVSAAHKQTGSLF